MDQLQPVNPVEEDEPVEYVRSSSGATPDQIAKLRAKFDRLKHIRESRADLRKLIDGMPEEAMPEVRETLPQIYEFHMERIKYRESKQ